MPFGPDTWHPDVTGSQMLESVHRLLEIEKAPDEEVRRVAPSRHSLSIGQELRSSVWRFLLTPSLVEYASSVPDGAMGTFKYTFLFHRSSMLVLIQSISPQGDAAWEDPSLPEGSGFSGRVSRAEAGIFLKSAVGPLLSGAPTIDELDRHLKAHGHTGIGRPHPNSGEGPEETPGILLVDSATGRLSFFRIRSDGASAARLFPVETAHDGAAGRLPLDLGSIGERRVGIVGLGSIGSKMALSLGRSGVSRFLLVDDDILLPENLCRHALDWGHVGEHKADAVAEALERIVPHPDVVIRDIRLMGQESNAVVNGVIRELGRCDIILDCTANPRAFNILAATAIAAKRPLVWMEVFGGGIGGMVARSRPGRIPGRIECAMRSSR